jgi:hypothetical protein
MHTALLAAALVALPAAALAQGAPGPDAGPPADVRAQMDQARADARTAAFAKLSPAHRAGVQAVIDRVNAGKLTDLADAAAQIDANLTPDESAAVLAQRQTLMAAMHHGAPNGGGPPPGMQPPGEGGAPPGESGPPPGAGPPGDGQGHGTHAADAGRFLLMLSVSRETMRALRQAAPNGGATAPTHGRVSMRAL